MKNKSKKIMIILGITILLITLGIVLPIIVKGDNNNAGKAQVLSGKTFTSGSLVASSGEMTDYSKLPLQTVSLAVNANGVQTLELQPGYYKSIQIDASALYQEAYNAGVAAGKEGLYTQEQYDAYGTQQYNAGLAAGVTTHDQTYTYPSGSTGAKYDLGINHKYRYVNAANVYAKGKADGQAVAKTCNWSYTITRYYDQMWGSIVVGGKTVVNFGGRNWSDIPADKGSISASGSVSV